MRLYLILPALFAIFASASPLPANSNSTIDTHQNLRARGDVLVTIKLDADVGFYCKTAYGKLRTGAWSETLNLVQIKLRPGEDLGATPIHFTQVTRAHTNEGRSRVEHECKLVGVAQSATTFRFASAVENYLYPCGPNNGLTIVCGQGGPKGNPAKCDHRAFQVLP